MDTDFADYIASALLICLALQPSPVQSVLRHPLLQWLGTRSFSIYLCHELVIAPVYHALHQIADAGTLFAASCTGGLVVSEIFYHLVEKRAHVWARNVWTSQGRAGVVSDADELTRSRPVPSLSAEER